jgi:ABC-type nitrate/sulfonate/bicarbonate transport system substrate-binding protein
MRRRVRRSEIRSIDPVSTPENHPRCRWPWLVIVVLLLAGTSQAANEAMTLHLAQSTPLLWPQSLVATSAGLWAKHGLALDPVVFATGREAMQALLGGRSEVAEVAPTPLVLAAFAGQPVRAFAVVARWSRWRVLVRTDRGIADASHLSGKRVGISIGTSSDLAFSYFLDTHGGSPATIEIVNVSPPDMIAALESGSVDAINIWQPFDYEAETRLGPRLKRLPYTFTNNYLLLTTTAVAARNSDLLRRVFAVMKDADRILTENRDKTIEWAAKSTGMKPEAIRAVWSEVEFGTRAPDERVLEEMQRFATFATKKKFVQEGAKVPDLRALFLSL